MNVKTIIQLIIFFIIIVFIYFFISKTFLKETKNFDNLDLNKEAGFNTASLEDDILDFTERNPFGEVDF